MATTPDGKVSVKVIAGESLGARAVINTRTPITYLHFTVQPGFEVAQPIPTSYNAFCYIIGGKGLLGKEGIEAERGKIIKFNKDGKQVTIGSAEELKISFRNSLYSRNTFERTGSPIWAICNE